MKDFTYEEFIKRISLIKEYEQKQEQFIKGLEALSPGTYCDCFLYSDYENMIIEDLIYIMDDKESDLIRYKMYEFDNWNESDKTEQLREMPYLKNWTTLFQYLNIKKGKNNYDNR